MKERAALGHAVAHWSFLEEKVLRATLGIAAEFRPTDSPTRVNMRSARTVL
jgi:hypothetical protein